MAAAAEQHYTLVITTSLGTRLLTAVATSISVSDAKRKIELEHYQLFPNKGEMRILQLKVEHKGSMYCLQDSMPLAAAYVDSTPFKNLFVEASTVIEHEHDGANEAINQPDAHNEKKKKRARKSLLAGGISSATFQN